MYVKTQHIPLIWYIKNISIKVACPSDSCFPKIFSPAAPFKNAIKVGNHPLLLRIEPCSLRTTLIKSFLGSCRSQENTCGIHSSSASWYLCFHCALLHDIYWYHFFDMWHVMMCVTFCVSCYCMATSINKMSVLLSLITILMNVNICLLI